jgi:hypothetical protein
MSICQKGYMIQVMIRKLLSAVLILSLLFLVACRGQEPSYKVIRKGSWHGKPPAPVGEVLLTVITPSGQSYDLDRKAIEQLTWVERTTRYHPRESDPPARFEGVLLKQIIDELHVPTAGLHVKLAALDDYQLERPWSDYAPLEPMLALVQDGKPLTLDTYGPVRIILPYDRLKPDPTKYNALWVWQLRVIDFRN